MINSGRMYGSARRSFPGRSAPSRDDAVQRDRGRVRDILGLYVPALRELIDAGIGTVDPIPQDLARREPVHATLNQLAKLLQSVAYGDTVQPNRLLDAYVQFETQLAEFDKTSAGAGASARSMVQNLKREVTGIIRRLQGSGIGQPS